MTASAISLSDLTIDSRDVRDRIEDLEVVEQSDDPADELDEDDAEELAMLRRLTDECEGMPDWEHGALLVNEHHWTDYARELAEEVQGASEAWPFTCIDWERAANELRMDYTEIDVDGVTFYVRS